MKGLFKRIESSVLPTRREAAIREEERNADALRDDPKAKVTKDHANALKRWWQLFRAREEMVGHITSLPRYIVCGRVTKRPIFEFLSSDIRPNDALTVFPFADNYTFGILQSGLHWMWFVERCSTLKRDPRYTSNTVFDTFPWPQSPKLAAIDKVAKTGRALRVLRRRLMVEHGLSPRDLYRSIELPGEHPLKDAHKALDEAVRSAYGMGESQNTLEFLLELNEEVTASEAAGEAVIGPGLPPSVKDQKKYITTDCIRMP